VTTSATATFDPTSDEIVKVALELCQVLPMGHEPEPEQLARGRVFLGLIMKSIANEGVSMRVVERVTFMTAVGTASITPDLDTEDVTGAFWTDTAGLDHPIEKRARDEYDTISQKTIQSPPTRIYFDKPNGNPVILLWPVTDANVVSVTYVRRRRQRDTDTGAVTLDLPQSWHLAVAWKLAAMLAPHFGMLDRVAAFQTQYEVEKELANNADTETGGLRFVPGEGLHG
jgi:hypothetical protein